jgi:hypothetical protein
MPSFIQRKLSFANVVSVIALFMALGGSSYAALRVGSAQIVDGSVRSGDIHNNTIRSRDIRNGSVLGLDLRNGTVTSADIRDGTVTGADVGHNALTAKDILESSLGTVPSAADAAKLDGKAASDFVGADRLVTTPFVRLTVGQTKTILRRGPFTWSAQCSDAGGGQVRLAVTLESTEANSFSASFSSQGAAVGPGSPATVFDNQSSSPAYSIGFPATAIAPSGAETSGFGWVGIKVPGSDCGVKMNLVG